MLGQKVEKKQAKKEVKITRLKGQPDVVEVKREDGFSDDELARENKGERPGKPGLVTPTSGTEKLAERSVSGRQLVTQGKPTTTGEQYRKPRAERIPRITGGRGFRITAKRPKLPR